MSIHWDRLDVKVAVRYPKSYGPRGGKGRDNDIDNDNMEEDDDDKVHLLVSLFSMAGHAINNALVLRKYCSGSDYAWLIVCVDKFSPK